MANILALIGVTSADSLGTLLPAFKIVQQMVDTYENIKFGQKRCKVVVQRAALIIKAVHNNPRSDQPSASNITELQKNFREVQAILQTLADMSFFKALLRFEDVNKEIARANVHLDNCSRLFPIDLSLHVQVQRKAEVSDRDALRTLLRIIAGNYEEIRRRFSLYSEEQEDQAMAVMEREVINARVTPEGDMPLEVQIMQRSVECVKATTGRCAPKQRKWLITEYDLEYCGTIGGGGFSTVSKARFRGTMVAVKVLKSIGNMNEALEREIEIWSRLRHDHIVPFYGASTLTSPPYIVSRYMQNGNLVQYLAKTPNVDRTRLILEVSLGMYYLHEEHIVHGDLKGVNVLVDDSGKACITDFGLSKVGSSGAAGTRTSKIAGTLRFLAPEALGGEPLSFGTDVYAFGMLIYEVFVEEVPFIREPDHKVLQGRVELQRPTSSKVNDRGFNDALWQLLSDCISREPFARPRFKTIQGTLSSMKKAEPSAQSVHIDMALGTEDEQLTDWELDTKPDIKPDTRFNTRFNTEPARCITPTSVSSAAPLLKQGRSVSVERSSTPSGPSVQRSRSMTPTLVNSAAPLLGQGKSVSVERSSTPSGPSVQRSIKTLQTTLPMCVVVTHKYFGVKFAVSSREPGVYLERANTTQWQPIRAKKGTLSSELGSKFLYRSSAGNGENSWELSGNDVILRTAYVNPGVCRFKDAQIARKWFGMQLSYARNGSVHDWRSVMGDWLYTEQSWRRLVFGMVQQADLVEGTPKAEPTERSWRDVDLPKRYIMDNYAGTENCIVCITDPGKRPGRLCCRLEGCRITFETYRHQSDGLPMNAREEVYPSEEYAEGAFYFLNIAIGKAAENNKSIFRSR